MRGLDAILVRIRAHRQLTEYRRMAAEATSSYLADRDRAEGRTGPNAGGPAQSASRLPLRRSLLAVGAAVALAVIALTAASGGMPEFNAAPRTSVPPTFTRLTKAAAVSPSTTFGAPSNATGSMPTSTAPTSAAPTGPAPGAPPVAATSTAPGTIPSATDSPSVAAAPVSTSPSVLDLCRTVVAAGNKWPSVLKAADRATVIAAAGKKNNVLAYCTNLVGSAS